MSMRLNFCRSVPPEFLRSFLFSSILVLHSCLEPDGLSPSSFLHIFFRLLVFIIFNPALLPGATTASYRWTLRVFHHPCITHIFFLFSFAFIDLIAFIMLSPNLNPARSYIRQPSFPLLLSWPTPSSCIVSTSSSLSFNIQHLVFLSFFSRSILSRPPWVKSVSMSSVHRKNFVCVLRTCTFFSQQLPTSDCCRQGANFCISNF